MKDYISFFKQANVFLHGNDINAKQAAKLVKRNLAAYLQSQSLQKFFYYGVLAYALELKNIFIQIA